MEGNGVGDKKEGEGAGVRDRAYYIHDYGEVNIIYNHFKFIIIIIIPTQ